MLLYKFWDCFVVCFVTSVVFVFASLSNVHELVTNSQDFAKTKIDVNATSDCHLSIHFPGFHFYTAG